MASSGNAKIVIIAGLAAIAGFGYWFFKKAKKLMSLDVNIDIAAIDKKQTNASNISLKIRVSIYNPNEEDIPFKKFIANMYYKDKLIANIDPYYGSATETIIGRRISNLYLRVNLPTSKLALSLITTVTDLLTGKSSNVPITLKGTLEAGELTIPVVKDLSFNVSDAV